MFTITITQKELEIIDTALQALPYGQVSVLYTNLKNQITEQVEKENSKTSEDKIGVD